MGTARGQAFFYHNTYPQDKICSVLPTKMLRIFNVFLAGQALPHDI
jgi:hypothetical protein